MPFHCHHLLLMKTDVQRKAEIWDLTLLTKSMREEMRGTSAAGDAPHTAGANT